MPPCSSPNWYRTIPARRSCSYFDEGRKIAPRYFPLYNCLSNYLLPKWHGQAGDVEKQAAKLRTEVGGDLGGEIYFRMACYFLHDFGGDGFFRDSDFKYEDLLPGMRVALRDYPENHFIYNVCCYMACLGGDKELAAQAPPRLDAATYSVPLWQGLGRLEYHRQKFDPKSHADDIAQSIASHIGIVTSVACLGDGSVLAGGEWPRLELWDIESGELLSSLSTENQIGKMAVEASGKVMVAAHGQGEYADSTAVVYALRGQGQPQPLAGHSAGVMSVAITRDGSRCATAARDNTARIWDLAGDAKPLVLSHPEWVYDCDVFRRRQDPGRHELQRRTLAVGCCDRQGQGRTAGRHEPGPLVVPRPLLSQTQQPDYGLGRRHRPLLGPGHAQIHPGATQRPDRIPGNLAR